MSQQNLLSKRRALLGIAGCAALLQTTGSCLAQAQQSIVLPTAILSELFKAGTIDAVLGKFRPAVNRAQVIKSDYLLLGAPAIALAGSISVRMMSEIPGTDLFMLFDNSPRPGQPSLLAATVIPGVTLADVTLPINLQFGTDLILLARSNGRMYSATCEIKLAQKDRA